MGSFKVEESLWNVKSWNYFLLEALKMLNIVHKVIK